MLTVGISEVVEWKGMAMHWDGKNRKDLEDEETETDKRYERGWGECP